MKIYSEDETNRKTNIIFAPICERCGYKFETVVFNRYGLIRTKICPKCKREIETISIINPQVITDRLKLDGEYEYTEEDVYRG